MQSVTPFGSCLKQELGRENSSAAKKDRLGYVKSHWKGSEFYRFSRSVTQIFLHQSIIVADISEDFEPPSKKFPATPLISSLHMCFLKHLIAFSYIEAFLHKSEI